MGFVKKGIATVAAVATFGGVGCVVGYEKFIGGDFAPESVPASLLNSNALGSLPVALVCEYKATTCDETHYLAKLSPSTRTPVDNLGEVGKNIVHAAESEENKNFRTDNGVSQEGIFRSAYTDSKALLNNVFHNPSPSLWWSDIKAALVQGGSTITQQGVKVDDPQRAVGVAGKFNTATRAQAWTNIETQKLGSKQAAKDDIELKWSNSVYVGRGAYGAEAGAEAYFGKHASELDILESATWASTIRNPSCVQDYTIPYIKGCALPPRQLLINNRNIALTNYAKDFPQDFLDYAQQHPDKFPSVPHQSQNATVKKVLNALMAVQPESYIIPDKTSLGITYSQEAIDSHSQHLIQKTITQAITKLGLHDKPGQSATEQLIAQNYKIYSTENLAFQQAAVKAAGTVKLGNGQQIAEAHIDPNGGLLSMLGGDSTLDLASESQRSMGSTFKGFTLGYSLDHGGSLDKTFDVPADGKPDTVTDPITKKPYTFNTGECANPCDGPAAFAFSSDGYFVRLAAQVGVHNVLTMMRQLGMNVALDDNLSDAIGVTLSNPLALAEGYNAIETDGVATPYYAVDHITQDGKVKFTHDTPDRSKHVISAKAAQGVAKASLGPVRIGTGMYSVKLRTGNARGKSGTTANGADQWWAGTVDTEGTAAFWMGNPDSEDIGYPGAGGTGPATAWDAYMKQIVQLQPVGSESSTLATPDTTTTTSSSTTTSTTVPPTTTTVSPSTTTTEVPDSTTSTTAKSTTTTTPRPARVPTTSTSTPPTSLGVRPRDQQTTTTEESDRRTRRTTTTLGAIALAVPKRRRTRKVKAGTLTSV